MKNLNWTTATAIGGRERNEDAFSNRNAPSLAPDGGHPVAVVCDGLGGHAHGEVASHAAVDAFMSHRRQGARPGQPATRSTRPSSAGSEAGPPSA